MLKPALQVLMGCALLCIPLSVVLSGCGGSGSETPPPLEPRPEEIERGKQPPAESPPTTTAGTGAAGASAAGASGQPTPTEPEAAPQAAPAPMPPANF
jgi:hypothetical protein